MGGLMMDGAPEVSLADVDDGWCIVTPLEEVDEDLDSTCAFHVEEEYIEDMSDETDDEDEKEAANLDDNAFPENQMGSAKVETPLLNSETKSHNEPIPAPEATKLDDDKVKPKVRKGKKKRGHVRRRR